MHCVYAFKRARNVGAEETVKILYKLREILLD